MKNVGILRSWESRAFQIVLDENRCQKCEQCGPGGLDADDGSSPYLWTVGVLLTPASQPLRTPHEARAHGKHAVPPGVVEAAADRHPRDIPIFRRLRAVSLWHTAVFCGSFAN